MASGLPSSDALVASLSKLRSLVNSKLDNQKAPAQLLIAVEQSLDEAQPVKRAADDKGDDEASHRSPAEYYLALESMLEKATSQQVSSSCVVCACDAIEADSVLFPVGISPPRPPHQAPPSLLPSTFYILSLVTHHVSAGILRSRLSSLLPALFQVLSNPHPASANAAESHSALLRSALTILQAILAPLSKDRPLLQAETQLRACWDASLELCADTRPKVRRKAQEVITAILSGQEGEYTGAKAHPYAARAAEWSIRTLASVSQTGGVSKSKASSASAAKYDVRKGRAQGAQEAAKQRQQEVAGGASVGIWVCGFLKAIVSKLPEKYIPQICEDLLRLPGLQNPFLTVSTFEVFEALYKPSRPVTPINAAPGSGGALAALSTAGASGSSNATDAAPTSLVRTLEALTSSTIRPLHTDVQLLPPYMRALEGAVVAYSRYEAGKHAWALFPALWDQVMELSLSAKSDASRSSVTVRNAGREALCSFIRYSIPESAVEEAVKKGGAAPNTTLGKIVASLDSTFGKQALQYTHSRGEVLSIVAALVTRLRVRLGAALQPAATQIVMPLIRTVADLRQKPKFEYRDQADLVLGAATEVCGPAALLKELPLGLLGESGPGKEGRAWLLPLMRGRITNATLGHFVNEVVPLSEKLFNARAEAEASKGRAVEAKMYEALVEQLWALFPGYCDLPVDLTDAFSQKFAEMLANVLYTQQSLRPSVLRGLTLLVERNEALSRSGAPEEALRTSFGITQADGKANISHLAALAPPLLAVLSNLLTQSPSSARGYISESIGAYLRILPSAEVKATYAKVQQMLDQSLAELVPQRDREVGPHAVPPTAHSMLDLLITLVPFLPVEDGQSLLDVAGSSRLLEHEDAGVQKKTYRILARLLEGAKGEALLRHGKGVAANVAALLSNVRKATVNVVPGAKRDRLHLLSALVPRIPSTELHLLPSIIPEAVLATKEANQGSRETAYDLLVEMGEKMKAGGKIKRGLVDAMDGNDEDEEEETRIQDDSEVDASLTEYFTMVGAGLAGGSPHMISATITSFSRLVYEFKEDVPRNVIDEVISTIEVFLSSPNREIVKSVLGFVKVAIVSLEFDLVNPHLDVMVPAMLNWSPDHRAHFKAKVRHIFERLLRRFGYERILALTDDENRKLVVNIKKRKDRAKRKKAAGPSAADEDDEDGQGAGMGARAPKSHGTDAFEAALYGSESELSSDGDSDGDDDDGNTARKLAARAAGARGGQRQQQRDQRDAQSSRRKRREEDATYILEDDDEPMDLLDRSASASGRILTGKHREQQQQRRRAPGQEASKFSLDEKTGRMVIDDPEAAGESHRDAAAPADGEAAQGMGAFAELSSGVDGHTHSGRGGSVRFNKNNKRTRIEEQEQERGLEAAEAEGGVSSDAKRTRKERERPAQQAIGREYRAKKAQGDVRKAGQAHEPFAYVPLSDVGGKKKGKGRNGGGVEITGKKKR